MNRPRREPSEGRRMKRTVLRLMLLAWLALLSGCSTMPIPRAYTEQELYSQCVRTGGRWFGESLGGCDYRGR
jgi:hypothetical protein